MIAGGETLIECCNRVSDDGKIILVCPTKISLHQFLELERVIVGENQASDMGEHASIINFWPENGGIEYRSESLKHLGNDFEEESQVVMAVIWSYMIHSKVSDGIIKKLLDGGCQLMRPFLDTSMTFHHNVHLTNDRGYYSNPSAGEILECLSFHNKLNEFITDIKYSFYTGFQLCVTLEKRKLSE